MSETVGIILPLGMRTLVQEQSSNAMDKCHPRLFVVASGLSLGTMLVPPAMWWDQHCAVTTEPALHLALKMSSRRNIVTRAGPQTLQSSKEGGNRIDYEDISPLLEQLKEMFAEECAACGTPARLEAIRGG